MPAATRSGPGQCLAERSGQPGRGGAALAIGEVPDAGGPAAKVLVRPVAAAISPSAPWYRLSASAASTDR
jgi:hypothetical protein